MSWHHGDYINTISSVGTLAAAIIALLAANESKKSSKNSLVQQKSTAKSDTIKLIYAELKQNAERCNLLIGNKRSTEWDFSQVVDLTNTLSSTKMFICMYSKDLSETEIAKAKEYFLLNITHVIRIELNTAIALPGVISAESPHGGDTPEEGKRIANLFSESRDYFSVSEKK